MARKHAKNNRCEYCGAPVRLRFCTGHDSSLKSYFIWRVDKYADKAAAADLIARGWWEEPRARKRLTKARAYIERHERSGYYDSAAVQDASPLPTQPPAVPLLLGPLPPSEAPPSAAQDSAGTMEAAP